MSVRKVVTASVAALALAAAASPVVNAQDEAGGTGALSVEGLGGGSLAEGSLSGLSADGPGSAEGSGGSSEGAGSADGSTEGSLGSAGEELSSIVPESDEVCDLPDLGGSVAKFYPLFGLTGIPTSVITLVTDALDSFPNLLDLVAGEGAGTVLLGQTGSLNGALCTSIFGGEMVMPPVTVIVDGDGNPITTVTGTIAAKPAQVTATSTAVSSQQSDGASTTVDGALGDTVGGDVTDGDVTDGDVTGGDVTDGDAPLPTTVPVPVA